MVVVERIVEVFASGDQRGWIEMGIWIWMQLGVHGIVVAREYAAAIQLARVLRLAGHQRWM